MWLATGLVHRWRAAVLTFLTAAWMSGPCLPTSAILSVNPSWWACSSGVGSAICGVRWAVGFSDIRHRCQGARDMARPLRYFETAHQLSCCPVCTACISHRACIRQQPSLPLARSTYKEHGESAGAAAALRGHSAALWRCGRGPRARRVQPHRAAAWPPRHRYAAAHPARPWVCGWLG